MMLLVSVPLYWAKIVVGAIKAISHAIVVDFMCIEKVCGVISGI